MTRSQILDMSPRSGQTAHVLPLLERHAGLLVAIVTALLCMPFTRSIWMLADEGIWLHAAQRMIDGQILYRDFFEFHPPLGFLTVAAWMAVFGQSLLAARLLMVLVIAMTAWLAYSCCRMISNRPGLSALLTLAWAVSVPGPWMQVNHHWFTSLFSMLTLWAILRADGKPARLTIAGFAACAATLVTTHRGGMIAAVGLLSILPQRSVKALVVYIASGLALVALALAYLWDQGTLMGAFDQVVLYAIGHYSGIQGLPYGAFTDLQTIFVVASFPLTASLLALLIWRKGTGFLREHHGSTAGLFALAGFAGCFPRPDAVHIAFCAVLVLPLLAGTLARLLPYSEGGPVLRTIGLMAVTLPLPSIAIAAMQSTSAPRVQTQAGTIRVVPPIGTIAVLDRLDALPPDDKIFFYPADPVLPFLTRRHHPARLDTLVPQYSTPAQYQETCIQLMRDAQWIVSHFEITKPDFYRSAFPAMTNPSPHEKIAFEAALKAGFVLDGRYGNFEILRRGKANLALCDSIATPD